MNRAVFLDRDGTVSEEIGYIRAEDMGRYALVPGSAGAMRKLRTAGYKLLLTTNQSGIGRGYFPQAQVEAVHRRLADLLAAENTGLDAVYFCPHHPEAGCDCRKPLPGMPRRAEKEWGLDLSRCWAVGDKPADVGLAEAMGGRGVLVLTGFGQDTLKELEAEGKRPRFVATDLAEAAEIILREDGK